MGGLQRLIMGDAGKSFSIWKSAMNVLSVVFRLMTNILFGSKVFSALCRLCVCRGTIKTSQSCSCNYIQGAVVIFQHYGWISMKRESTIMIKPVTDPFTTHIKNKK